MAIDVPDYVSTAAERGLEWHAEGKSGDGVTDQTLREARDMAGGSVSEDKVRRMGPWFRRHRPDMDAPKNNPDNEDFPGAGAVAWHSGVALLLATLCAPLNGPKPRSSNSTKPPLFPTPANSR